MTQTISGNVFLPTHMFDFNKLLSITVKKIGNLFFNLKVYEIEKSLKQGETTIKKKTSARSSAQVIINVWGYEFFIDNFFIAKEVIFAWVRFVAGDLAILVMLQCC